MWDASKQQVTVTLGLLEDVLLSSAMLASLVGGSPFDSVDYNILFNAYDAGWYLWFSTVGGRFLLLV